MGPSTTFTPSFPPTTLSTSTSHKRTSSSHPTFHFLAGLASGVSSGVLLQPADLLKTRVQQTRSSALLPVLRTILASPQPITSLWRGTVPSALRTGFGSALYFTSLNTLRQLVANNNNNDDSARQAGSRSSSVVGVGVGTSSSSSSSSVLPKLSSTSNLLTGASARVFAGVVLMPVTVIKVRYESDFYAYKSMVGASRSIYASEGLRGFFAGFGATAIRDAPYAGLYVVFYEGGKGYLARLFAVGGTGAGTGAGIGTGTGTGSGTDTGTSTDTSTGNKAVGRRREDGRQRTTTVPAVSINATSGVVAAAAATAITNPFDAVKTRLQLMPVKYKNMVRATRLMMKEDGIRGFFDGLALRMGRKAVSSALAWTVYEELIRRAERGILIDGEGEGGGGGEG